MKEFDAILFDFDGVLADTEPVHFACWSEVLAPLGVRMEPGFYERYFVGVPDAQVVRFLADAVVPPRDWEALWARYPKKQQLFRDRVLSAPPFVPELAGLLEELHSRYRMAVVTASARADIEPLLAAGGLSRHFDVLVCGQEAGRHKPEPDPYLLAARLLNAARPLVVEDSEPGLASARAAGFEALRVPSAAEMPELLRRRLGGTAANSREP
jgi:beta-phosphoglucomutase